MLISLLTLSRSCQNYAPTQTLHTLHQTGVLTYFATLDLISGSVIDIYFILTC